MSIHTLRAKMAARKIAATLAAAPPAVPVTPEPAVAVVLTQIAEAVSKQLGTTAGQLNKNQVNVSNFNADQQLAVSLAKAGKSFCLIGGAGTGKTTTTRGIVSTLFESGIIGKLTASTDKLFVSGKPAVAILSFTNQAVRNIATALPSEFRSTCSTFHNAVEYHPDYFDVQVLDDNGAWTGDFKNTMRFIPKYGKEGSSVATLTQAARDASTNSDHHHSDILWEVTHGEGVGLGELLPHLDVVIVEESGSVPRDLFYTFVSALPNPSKTMFVFLGDLNQLPPVFDDAILGFMLLTLPVIELTEFYRNVGLVTKVAQRILTGKPIRDKEATADWRDGGLSGTDESGTVTFKPYKVFVNDEIATPSAGKHLKQMVLSGEWDENTSVVLIPQNIKFGQVQLNKWIGQGIAERDDLAVHHVTFNGQHLYFCIGDKVMFNKKYHRITSVNTNLKYKGPKPLPASKYVNRWGTIQRDHEAELLGGMTRKEYEKSIDVDEFLDSFTSEDIKGAGNQSSAVITLVLDVVELDERQLLSIEHAKSVGKEPPTFGECTASGAGEVTNILPVYAMTVHKAQGSEWLNVLLIMHRSHGKMLQRELLYTGTTRARTNLTVWYSGEDDREPGVSNLSRGIMNQAIKGKTLEEKLDYFRNKLKVEVLKEQLAAKKSLQF
jgi:hypothetical protein